MPGSKHVSALQLDASQLTYLLHDTSFALRECDVTTRLVLDELDLDLTTLSSWLVIVVVVVVRSSTGTGALDASAFESAIAVLEVLVRRR